MSSSAKLIHSETPGPIELSILTKIQQSFSPTYLKIVNDSHKHAHHAGIRGATNTTESHFNIEIVSSIFEGKGLPSRHRLVYSLLDDEIKHKGVHALQLKTKTESEINKTI
ncbi:hypothetical protein JA1_001554 [Spathaspora sp. JA1]|nr:hypothetical protein JA1_001554 [Spathaspora sp. JA1]